MAPLISTILLSLVVSQRNTKKWMLKMCGPQIRLCLFSFRTIASKQLNSLTTRTIDILSWLGGAVVTHPLWVQEVPSSIPGSGKGFYVWFFVLLLLCFYFWSKNTLFIAKCCNSFYNVSLFSILNVLQDLWPIIRVKRYRPSIFKPLFCINFITKQLHTANIWIK